MKIVAVKVDKHKEKCDIWSSFSWGVVQTYSLEWQLRGTRSSLLSAGRRFIRSYYYGLFAFDVGRIKERTAEAWCKDFWLQGRTHWKVRSVVYTDGFLVSVYRYITTAIENAKVCVSWNGHFHSYTVLSQCVNDFCVCTDSGMTASYIKLFALLLVLNILWFLAADTRMPQSSTIAIDTDVQVHLVRFKCKTYSYCLNKCSLWPPLFCTTVCRCCRHSAID